MLALIVLVTHQRNPFAGVVGSSTPFYDSDQSKCARYRQEMSEIFPLLGKTEVAAPPLNCKKGYGEPSHSSHQKGCAKLSSALGGHTGGEGKPNPVPPFETHSHKNVVIIYISTGLVCFKIAGNCSERVKLEYPRDPYSIRRCLG